MIRRIKEFLCRVVIKILIGRDREIFYYEANIGKETWSLCVREETYNEIKNTLEFYNAVKAEGRKELMKELNKENLNK